MATHENFKKKKKKKHLLVLVLEENVSSKNEAVIKLN